MLSVTRGAVRSRMIQKLDSPCVFCWSNNGSWWAPPTWEATCNLWLRSTWTTQGQLEPLHDQQNINFLLWTQKEHAIVLDCASAVCRVGHDAVGYMWSSDSRHSWFSLHILLSLYNVALLVASGTCDEVRLAACCCKPAAASFLLLQSQTTVLQSRTRDAASPANAAASRSRDSVVC